MWLRRFSIAHWTGTRWITAGALGLAGLALAAFGSTVVAQQKRPSSVWRLSQAPQVSIGGAGDGAEGFGRVVGAARLSSEPLW
jgi:hypothetical protein